MVILRKKRGKINYRLIRRYKRRVGVEYSLKLSIIELHHKLKECYRNYYALKKNAKLLRELWIQDLVTSKSKQNR